VELQPSSVSRSSSGAIAPTASSLSQSSGVSSPGPRHLFRFTGFRRIYPSAVLWRVFSPAFRGGWIVQHPPVRTGCSDLSYATHRTQANCHNLYVNFSANLSLCGAWVQVKQKIRLVGRIVCATVALAL
jgi:hypothetical protein